MEIGVAAPNFTGVPHYAAQVRTAEQAGVDSFWTYDSGHNVEPFAQAAFLATLTQRARICAGFVNPFIRHPAVVASGAATVDRLSGGRCALVMGVGWRPAIDVTFGISRGRPYHDFEAGLRVVQQLLAGEEVTFRGDHFALAAVRLTLPPTRPDLPIYVGGGGQRALRIAARYAEGFLADFGQADVRYVQWMREEAQAARPSGTPPLRLGLALGLRIVEDTNSVLPQEKRSIAWTLATSTRDPYFDLVGIDPELRERLRRALGIDDLIRRGRDPHSAYFDSARLEHAAACIPDDIARGLIPHNALVGSPRACAVRLAELAQHGVDFVLLHFPARYAETLDGLGEIIGTLVRIEPKALSP